MEWSRSPTFIQVVQVAISIGTLLVATLFIGATFPCAVALVRGDASRAGLDVGRLYAVNTLGAIAGTALTGLVLLPLLGAHASIRTGSALNVLVAAGLFLVSPGGFSAARYAGIALSLVIAGSAYFARPWDQALMSSGPAIYGLRNVPATSGTPGGGPG